MPLDNRFGRIRLEIEVLEDNEELAREIMGQLIIVRAEFDYVTKQLEYTAHCPAFELLEPGQQAPWYDIEVDTDAGSITWKKQEA